MCVWDPRVAALPEKQMCPTAVFWLGWGPGIAVMSPCTPAHPPKWVRCAPRGIYISPTLQSLRLLLSWGKSALNQERTRMQCDLSHHLVYLQWYGKTPSLFAKPNVSHCCLSICDSMYHPFVYLSHHTLGQHSLYLGSKHSQSGEKLLNQI